MSRPALAPNPIVASLDDAGESTYEIQGQTVRLPVEVRDATNAYASFLVPSEAVRRLLPPGLVTAEGFPGRSLCTIGAIEYRDNDLGQYNEVAIAFMVCRGSARAFFDLVRGNAAAYIHRLPVNASFTCAAGSTIWGYPKTVEDIQIADSDGWRTCALRSKGSHVLTISIKSRGGLP